MTSLERLLLVSALLLGGLAVFLIVVGFVFHRARRLTWHTTWRHLLIALVTICACAVLGAIVSGIAGLIMTPFLPADQIRVLILYTAAVGGAFGGFWAAVRILEVREEKEK
jgi:peptidoglycan biosynthesis protein MviN/MurJ (putative lipid II flippase)